MSQHHHEEKSYTNSFNISKSETFKSVTITGPPGGFDGRTSVPLITQETWTPSPSAASVVVDKPAISKETAGNESTKIVTDTVYEASSTTGISASMSMPTIFACLFIFALLIILGLICLVVLTLTGVLLIPGGKPTLAPYSGPDVTELPSTTTLPLIYSTIELPAKISTLPPDKQNTNVNITCLHDLHSIGSKTSAVTISSLYSKQNDWDWNDAPYLGTRGPKISLQILSKSLEQVANLNRILDWLRNRVENVTLDVRGLIDCPTSGKELITPIILPEVGKLEIFNLTRCLINNVLKYWQIPKVLEIFVYCTDQKESYSPDLQRLLNPKLRHLNNFTVMQKHCHDSKYLN